MSEPRATSGRSRLGPCKRADGQRAEVETAEGILKVATISPVVAAYLNSTCSPPPIFRNCLSEASAMSEEIEAEQQLSRIEIADYFEEIAEKLRSDEPVPVSVGFKTFYVDPPTTVTFEAEVEDEGEELGSAERNVEFELKWQTREGDAELDELSTIQ